MANDIYQHYRPQEYAFIDQVLGWCLRVQERYTALATVFLTPREQMIVEQLVGKYEGLLVSFFGGFSNAERQKALIYPEYLIPEADDYEIAVVEVTYPKKFNHLTHPQILGALMSLGIERERLGDIITNGEHWQFFIDHHLLSYVQNSLDKIGRMGVKLQSCSFEDVLMPDIEWVEDIAIVASLRVDSLVSAVYNLSRQQAKQLIERGDVKLNFATVQKPNDEVALNDLVSVRRQGRFKVYSLEGITRKNNLRVSILQLSDNKQVDI